MYLIQYYVPLKPCTLNVRKAFKKWETSLQYESDKNTM